jgi:signal transduction histidine kinase
MDIEFMNEDDSFEIIQEIDDKDIKIKELQKKLEETETKLNEFNRSLEQRVIERTVEVNKLLKHKIKFIDSLSHDLATPLTPLISMLPLIKEDIKKKETRELIDVCLKNVEYIKRVITNARELADISSHSLMLKKENLFDIIDELSKKYEIVFKGYNIEIKNNLGKDIFVKTDKNRLLQLLDHVISNSVNSMPSGGTLSFESKYVKKESGPFVQLSVKDTGVGLTREQTDHIFDEFYKTDESRHKLDSTGLGLAICKTIIEKHGGKIWADSHGPGTGSTIHLTVPTDKVVYDRSF